MSGPPSAGTSARPDPSLAAPGAAPHTPLQPASVVLRRAARLYLAPRWRTLAACLVLAAAAAGLTGALVKLLQPAIDALGHIAGAARSGGSAGGVDTLRRLTGLIVVLALGRGLVQIVQARLVSVWGAAVVAQIQGALFGRLIRADLARLRAAHSGTFVSAMLYDTGLVREAATAGLVNAVQQGLTLIAMAAVMLSADWRLTLCVVIAGPLVGFVLRAFGRRSGRAARDAMATTADLTAALLESLDGARVVKIDGREAFEEQRVGAAIAARQRHMVSGDIARASAAPVSETLMTAVVAAVLLWEGARASAGRMEVGAFLAFFAALLSAGQAVRQLAAWPGVLSAAIAAAGRLFALADDEPRVRDAPGARSLAAGPKAVRFERAGFAYDPAGPAAVRDVDLAVDPGQTVALVGRSGAGKTTLLNLIPRFYDVTAGRVTVGGADVRDLTLASLRAQIALVTQEAFLFDDSVGANIAYARPEAGAEAIEHAARSAAAHDFIAALPNGYETRVGQGGTRLSGGQRQRIAIARAFLKDAPILLLDEATSALDAENEAQVQAALAKLIAGRATLIVAHRLSTIRAADVICVLDEGSIVERGRHADLLARGGVYARLVGGQETLGEAAE